MYYHLPRIALTLVVTNWCWIIETRINKVWVKEDGIDEFTEIIFAWRVTFP